MSRDLLASATAALRAAGHDESHDLAAATRVRLRRSLEVRARSRHRLVRAGAIMLVLFVSTVSWAWSTGRLAIFAPSHHTSERVIGGTFELPSAKLPITKPQPHRAAVVSTTAPDAWPVAPLAPDQPITVPVAPIAPTPPVHTLVVRPRPAAELLYRKAHELHFHGGDQATALAAWDAYLAAEPTGRFAVEARYNRGLLLVRLGRYAEARSALAPFARGEVAPAQYRQRDAAQIVERLDKLVAPVNDPASSGY